MSFQDYSLTPDDNTTLGDGTYIGPNMLRNKVRPALQQLAADGKALANDLQDIIDVATGPAGPAGNVAITLAVLKAAPTTNRTMIAAFAGGASFNWETANAPYTADDVNIVKADSTALSVGAWIRSDTARMAFPTATGGTDGLGVVSWADAAKGRFFYGGTDATPQNDEGGFWTVISSASGTEGLNRSPNPSDQGVYSFGWGRNSIGYASYSYAIGHDNITFGVASLAGGAGSVTGDPAHPKTGVATFLGYCSIAWGKVCQAVGQSSAAFGERAAAMTRSAIALGYSAVAKGALGSVAAGNDVQTNTAGDLSLAIGTYIRNTGSNSSSIGSGINPGSPFTNALADTLGIGVTAGQPTTYWGAGVSGDSYTGWFGSRAGFRSLLDNGGTTNLNAGVFYHFLENSASGGTTSVTISGRDAGTVREFFKVKSNADLFLSGTKVLGARDTGWTAMTGTGSKAALAAAAAGTASGTYVQAELQAALNRIAALEARMKSYDAALVAHGLIGA